MTSTPAPRWHLSSAVATQGPLRWRKHYARPTSTGAPWGLSLPCLRHVQFQQVASARHPTKANTAKALVEPGDFPALWLDGLSLKPANHHSTPNLGHQALLISCGLHGHRHKKSPRARLKTVETDPIFEAKHGLKFEASFGFKH